MLKTITPINNSIYVEREYSNPETIDKALNSSKKILPEWKGKSINERKNIVTKFVNIFIENHIEIEDELCRQMGRPISQCNGEIKGFEERARYMIDKSEEALENIISKKKQ